ncbi:conserved hypothetical protein [Catenulispora acidiphila DSM 44928]|uniref:Ferric siderophore reductase C-terminal domain-containing protein n=1 Tax=Catenulispora acidiphila (strain DSM 44928 / JCM 14897 / NBRC 102108 / NRRL B-24433 / ID139908) TaxID=479433 RepID=C7QDS4_CATAD|nr:(2Fe-2S)-binding protein [Catenulispora acidiphila]ACU74698.1 conserved hypothetical protein [Catenulispora acidiphila DSM 44928]
MTAAGDGVTALAPVSDELAALGPFFAVEFHEAGSLASPWQQMSSLTDFPCSPDVPDVPDLLDALAERVAAVRAFLASGTAQKTSAVELRVAASVVHLGLVARVLSPLLALAVLHQRYGSVHAADLRWQPTLGSMFPLSVRASALAADGATFADGVLAAGVVGEFGTAIARFGVNEHIVRGNVASALAGAGKTLAAARPDLRADIQALIDELLAGPELAGSGGFQPDGAFRRRSCCLIYRAAPTPTPTGNRDGALCGDCVLAPEHGPMEI